MTMYATETAIFRDLFGDPKTVKAHTTEDGRKLVLIKSSTGGSVLTLTPDNARQMIEALTAVIAHTMLP